MKHYLTYILLIAFLHGFAPAFAQEMEIQSENTIHMTISFDGKTVNAELMDVTSGFVRNDINLPKELQPDELVQDSDGNIYTGVVRFSIDGSELTKELLQIITDKDHVFDGKIMIGLEGGDKAKQTIGFKKAVLHNYSQQMASFGDGGAGEVYASISLIVREMIINEVPVNQ